MCEKEEPIAVGLDMSLQATGFCLKQGINVTIDTIKTTPRSAENDLARLRLIATKVMEKIPKDVTMICVEDFFTPQNRAQSGAAIKLAMLGTVMRMTMYEAGYPFCVVVPGQIKKFLTGKGNAQKSIMVREVYKRYGIDAKDDNQADACVMAHVAEAVVNDGMELTQFQEEVRDKVKAERPFYNTGESDAT